MCQLSQVMSQSAVFLLRLALGLGLGFSVSVSVGVRVTGVFFSG